MLEAKSRSHRNMSSPPVGFEVGRPVNRLEFLDSLRGFAALFVILHHLPLAIAPQLPIPGILEPLVMYGWTGVELFFVISAFSLCLTMPKHENRTNGWLSYTVSRISRIAPLFYVLVAVNYVRDIYVWGVWHTPQEVIASLTFVFNVIPGWQGGFVGASWTIGAEMLFYVIFPVLYVRLPSMGSRLVFVIFALIFSQAFKAVTGLLISDPATHAGFWEMSLGTHLPTFGLGMVCFSIFESLRTHPRRKLVGAICLVIGFAGLGTLIRNPYSFGVIEPVQWPGVFYAIILLGAGLCPIPILSSKVMQFYGRISYSVYLWHWPILITIAPVYYYIYASWNAVLPSFIACLALTVAVVTAVATASYYTIESAGNALGKRVIARWSSRKAVSPSLIPAE